LLALHKLVGFSPKLGGHDLAYTVRRITQP
jgi:hypothetical protein